MEKKRVILTAGGTGGHLFPAQSVADQLQNKSEILFVGGGLSKNRYFDGAKYPFVEIQTSSLNLRNPIKALMASYHILRGFFQSLKIIAKFKPTIVVGFGSFFTFPLLLAAKWKKIPILLHEQNSLPGKVNRLFSAHAVATAITFPETAALLRGKTIQIAFPLRWSTKPFEKKISCDYFGLESGKSTLLVFGGSQGGLGLNRLFLEVAPQLPLNVQVVHFTGSKELKEKAENLYRKLGLGCCVKEFESKMHLAWNFADLAITRAGASTIAELIAWEVPALLIPFPYATDAHQEKNGKHFTECVKGGEMFLEGKTKAHDLELVIKKYLKEDLFSKKEEIRNYKKNNKCLEMHELILRI